VLFFINPLEEIHVEALAIVLQFGLAILVMANGVAILFGGKAMAMQLNRWVGRSFRRVSCRLVGGIFSWIGRTISRWGR
jgi:hypothetical protein